MNVIKASNTNFSHLNDKHNNARKNIHANVSTNSANTSQKASNSRQLVPTQPAEYKRFHAIKQHANNPFLAQYIDQTNMQKRRAFIGRKPAWQAKKSYQNSANIINSGSNSHLDTSI